MAGEFELRQLLAAPVVAMNDAQADAAATFVELLDQFAFEEPASGEARGAPRSLRMIGFVAERAIAGGRVERREISMPLLQLIPLGGIGIDTARLEFTVALTAAPAGAGQRRTAPAPVGAADRSLVMVGRIAPGGAAKPPADGGILKVEINLRQMDLPAGYLDMIAETQGGAVRTLDPEPAEEPGLPGETALFTAAIRGASARQAVAAGRELRFTLDIKADPRLVGTGGLELRLASDPPRGFALIEPDPVLCLDPGARSVPLAILVAETAAQQPLSLTLSGRATDPQGRERCHRIALPLFQKG